MMNQATTQVMNQTTTHMMNQAITPASSAQPDGYLTTNGFVMLDAHLKRIFVGNLYDSLLTKLTVVYIPTHGPREIRCMYKKFSKDGSEYIALPRSALKVFKDTKLIRNVAILMSFPAQLNMTMQCTLFDDQAAIVNHLMTHVFSPTRLHDGTASCLLNLVAGGGKTFVAGAIIAALKYPTLYITIRKELAKQAVDDLRSCLYDKGYGTHSFVVEKYDRLPKTITTNGKQYPNMKCGVCVVIINTAIKLPVELLRGFGCVVFDEAHTLCTEKRSIICARTTAPAHLGLSGTTEDRNDPFDIVIHKELALDGVIRAEKIVPKRADDKPKFKIEVHVIKYVGHPDYSHVLCNDKTGKMSTHLMLNQFMKDPYRSQLIMSEIRKLYEWRGCKLEPRTECNIAHTNSDTRNCSQNAQCETKRDIQNDQPKVQTKTINTRKQRTNTNRSSQFNSRAANAEIQPSNSPQLTTFESAVVRSDRPDQHTITANQHNSSNERARCNEQHREQVPHDEQRSEQVSHRQAQRSEHEQHCIFVFCEEREPLIEFGKKLATYLSAYVSVPELDIGTFIGGISEQQSNDIKQHARIILATYTFAGTGISLLKATAICLLSSRRSQFKQIVARILRTSSNYNIPRIIIDVVNVNTPMKHQFGSRKLAYEYYGAQIQYKKIAWSDVVLSS